MAEKNVCGYVPDEGSTMSKNCLLTNDPAIQVGKGNKAFMFNIDNDVEGIKASMQNHLRYTLAKPVSSATPRDWWLAMCHAVRDRIVERFMKTQKVQHKNNVRRLYYFSMEYLLGRLLSDVLYNSGLIEPVKEALKELELDFDTLCNEEEDMGLGNGGLGRLAACFLDSLATLEYPAIGYGIHYEFGLFRQEFVEGNQVEHPDNWVKFGNPWQLSRPQFCQEIPLYGRIEQCHNDHGDFVPCWVDTKMLIGMPWDIPIVGYGACCVNFLRLWESRASEEFDLQVFNEGGYVEAVHEKVLGETISKVLYPDDATESGKELRLVQQYFFVACSLRDLIRRYHNKNKGWDKFPEKVAIQLNDTHPAIAIAELMRIFIDDHQLNWDYSWDICKRVFAYTNHTLLPEALEKWSVPLLEKVIPRHLQIIYQINEHFLHEVEAHWPGDEEKKKAMSIVEEGSPKMIRMAYLSTIASHSINGVAALHTELLKGNLFHDFYELYPNRFNNKTNGITPRRWLKACNAPLSHLIDRTLNEDWALDLEKLRALEKHKDDESFLREFMDVKKMNKQHLAEVIRNRCNIDVNVDAIFDVQIKRLHEYKRQHLNLLHILTLYHHLLHDPSFDIHPRVFIFAAKAAPGYALAKEIIYAINAVGNKINHDERINGKLKVVFLPNYNVSLAADIIPAADLSEQISTAGKEASGTGNMKLALNGACTIGTLDGANVEMLEEVGDENIFIFGMTVDEVKALKQKGYNPREYYDKIPELKIVIDWLFSGFFTDNQTDLLKDLQHSFFDGGDPFMVLADYEAYCQKQTEVDAAFRDTMRWARMALLNTSRMGKFSSDRTIREYANDIWNLESHPVGP